ncbi:MAG: ABC transporter substrate-binding protein [Candidatus Anammoxibacter sp.]
MLIADWKIASAKCVNHWPIVIGGKLMTIGHVANYMKINLSIIILSVVLSLWDSDGFAFEIVTLKSKDITPYNKVIEEFRGASKANIIDYVVADSSKKNRVLIKKIKSTAPDLIFTVGLKATLLVKGEFGHVPIVFAMVMRPEKHGLAGKKNITGITLDVSIKEQIQKLKAAIPYVKELGIICSYADSSSLVNEAHEITKKLGINLVSKMIISEKSVPKALRSLIKKVDCLWLVADPTVVTKESFKFLLMSSFENNVPIMAYSEGFVKAGALLSLSPDYCNIGIQAAHIVDDVLRNNLLPNIQHPDITIFSINLKTAGKMGIIIPAEVINSAEKVFE